MHQPEAARSSAPPPRPISPTPTHPVSCGSGLEPDRLRAQGAPDLRPGRGRRAQATAGAGRIRRGVAVPSLRRVRRRRAADVGSSRRSAARAARQRGAKRAHPAGLCHRAVPARARRGRDRVRGVAVRVRPRDHRAGLRPRAPGTAQPVPPAWLQHRQLQACGAVRPRADAQPDDDQAARHRAGLLRGDRGGRGRRPVGGQTLGRVLRDGRHVGRPAVRDLRPGQQGEHDRARPVRHQPVPGAVPGHHQAAVRRARGQAGIRRPAAQRVDHGRSHRRRCRRPPRH